MLDVKTRQRIDAARDILVGKVPDPKSQVEQITLALMYKFMDDMDAQSEELDGKASFFTGDFERYSWRRLVGGNIGAHDALNLYSEGIMRMGENPELPQLFRQMFNNAYLPYRDPETLRQFLQIINEFSYDNSERLGDAFEYLLSIMGSQGDAGQFRTPRHIIDFIVEIVNPKKDDIILDPACGTAGFLISAYKHIVNGGGNGIDSQDRQYIGLTASEKTKLARNVKGYDISPDMVRLSQVNLYLHGFADPNIREYDTLTSEDNWNEYASVILANPPFMSPKGGIRPHNRFSVTSKRSEVLFVDYIAKHLTPNGRAGVIVPEGIIFQSQNAHKQLRKMLVEDYLVAVISLPPGVFNPYSGVKTSILILDKALAKRSDTIGFFKVENDGFDLGAQRRPIDSNDLPQVRSEITEYLRRRREGSVVEEYETEHGLVVIKEQIVADGDFNLSGERYRRIPTKSSRYEWVKLSTQGIFSVEGGGTPRSNVSDFWDGDVPWITLADLPADDIVTEITATKRNISVKGLHNSSAKVIPAHSIVVSSRATIGRVGINRIPLATNQGFKNIIIENDSIALPEYVAHAVIHLIPEMHANASGSTYKEIIKSRFGELTIPLPPIEVQREIVSEIEGYQRVIDGARMVVENWRPRIAVDPDWPLVELGEVATVQSGFGFPKAYQGETNEEIPFLKVSDMNLPGNDSRITIWNNSVSRKTLRVLKAKSMPKGTVIFPKIGAAIATNKKRILTQASIYDNNVMGIIPKDGYLLSEYLHAYLSDFNISDWSSDAQPPSMRKTTVEKHIMHLPQLTTQQSIIAEIEVEREFVDANRRLIDRMEARVREVVGRLWRE